MNELECLKEVRDALTAWPKRNEDATDTEFMAALAVMKNPEKYLRQCLAEIDRLTVERKVPCVDVGCRDEAIAEFRADNSRLREALKEMLDATDACSQVGGWNRENHGRILDATWSARAALEGAPPSTQGQGKAS